MGRKPSKVSNHTKQTINFSRSLLGHPEKFESTSRGQNPVNTETNPPATQSKTLVLENSKSPLGKTKLRNIYCTDGKVTLQVNTDHCQSITGKQTLPEISNTRRCHQRATLVAESHGGAISNISEIPNMLYNHGCSRQRMGSNNELLSSKRTLEPRPNNMAQQPKRALGSLQSFEYQGSRTERNFSDVADRQQNLGCVYYEAGRYKINETSQDDLRDFRITRKIQYPPNCQVPPGSLQRHSGQFVSLQPVARVASEQRDYRSNLQNIRNSASGPICDKQLCSGTNVCVRRCTRPKCPFCGCLQQTVELQTSLRISASGPSCTCSSPFRPMHRNLPTGGTQLEENFLASSTQAEIESTTINDTQHRKTPDRSPDEQTTTSCRNVTIAGLANTGWCDMLKGWSRTNITLIESSWRKSTQKTYRHAWRKWLHWCSINNYQPYKSTPDQTAQYLCHLYNDIKLAPRTILLHKSVVVTFANPLDADRINNHPLVKHILKGIQSQQPPLRRPPIWNVDNLVDHLNRCTVNQENLFEVSRHVAALLLLASGRRVHDLTLLQINDGYLIDNDTDIILFPKYGSKTDSNDHQQSGWKLLKNTNKKMDIVSWIRTLITISNQRRSSQGDLYNLFITTRGKVRGASRTVIAGWIRTLLREANISGSPGSFRAAVASNILHKGHEFVDEVLKRGNWKSRRTVFNHYYREINASNGLSSRINPMLQNFVPI